MVHSYSRVVLELLTYAAKDKKKQFMVYVTESAPDHSGYVCTRCIPKITRVCVTVFFVRQSLLRFPDNNKMLMF